MDFSIIHKLAIFLLFILNSNLSLAKTLEERFVCVFDPVGRSGDVFTTAKDIALDFSDMGYKFTLYPYSTESAAQKDFELGLCDAMASTGSFTSKYNKFASSIEAIGGVLDYESLRDLLYALMRPKAAKFFTGEEYEVVGIFPAGSVYFHLRDKKLQTIDQFENKNIFILREDPIGEVVADQLGAKGIKGNTTNFASLFKRGKVDATLAPVVLTETLELDKAMGEQGGILRVPLLLLTIQVTIRKEKFPEKLGQVARMRSLKFFDQSLELSLKAEKNLPPSFWITPSNEEMEKWDLVHERIRQQAVKEGRYDPRMLKIMHKVRCVNFPQRRECLNTQ